MPERTIMTGRPSANHFLRSNPRTARAVDTFIGGIGARRRRVSERVITQSDVIGGRMHEGGVWTPRVGMQDAYTEYEEEAAPERWYGHKNRGAMNQGKKRGNKGKDSGYLGDSPVWITLHKQVRVNPDLEQMIAMAEEGQCPLKHTNKMAGMASINVSTDNEFCTRMRELAKERNELRWRIEDEGRDPDAMGLPSLICAGCYATKLENSPERKPTKAHYTENADLLGSRVLEIGELPVFKPGEVIRFHAFGDMANEYHFANVFNIVNRNEQSYFTIWSKNFDLFHQYLVRSGNAKPPNLTIIYSNNEIDTIRIDPLTNGPMQQYVDGTFNVIKKKDIHNLVYGDIKNFERYFPGIDPATPIRFGPDATLGLTFVYCDAFCIHCKNCYKGLTRFVVLEDFRKTKKIDPFENPHSRRRGGSGITMTRMGFRVSDRGRQRGPVARRATRPQPSILVPPRRAPSAALPRRQVRDDRYRMPTTHW